MKAGRGGYAQRVLGGHAQGKSAGHAITHYADGLPGRELRFGVDGGDQRFKVSRLGRRRQPGRVFK